MSGYDSESLFCCTLKPDFITVFNINLVKCFLEDFDNTKLPRSFWQ